MNNDAEPGWEHLFGTFELGVRPGTPRSQPQASPLRPGPWGVNVVGNLASEKGVGESVRAVVRGLAAAGIPYTLVDFPDPGAANAERFQAGTARHLPHPVTILSVNPDVFPQVSRCFGPDFSRGRYTIGNWHWELADLPPNWIAGFSFVDEVWVGSRFTLDAVSKTAPVPVVCIPPSLAFDSPPGELTRASLGLPAGAFVFLFVFDLASTVERKNPIGLIRAFQSAFPTTPDVRLAMKFSRADRYPGKREMIEAANRDGRIVLLDGVLPRGQIGDLIATCDCYVSLHRAEGFGLTLAEAMAQAKPVIATGYSGNTDFATQWNSYPVKYRLVPNERAAGPYPAGAMWAEPDEADAARLMHLVFENREAAAAIGKAGQETVHAMFHPTATGKLMARRLERFRPAKSGQL